MVSMRTSMRHFQIIGELGAVVLACSALGVAQDVHYNFMPGTNFSNFHTFKWVGYIGRFEPVNQILAQENPGRNRWPTDGEGVSPRPTLTTRTLSLAFRLPFSSRDVECLGRWRIPYIYGFPMIAAYKAMSEFSSLKQA
jgi:hypothetical protein